MGIFSRSSALQASEITPDATMASQTSTSPRSNLVPHLGGVELVQRLQKERVFVPSGVRVIADHVMLEGRTRLQGQLDAATTFTGVLVVEKGASLKGDLKGSQVENSGSIAGTVEVQRAVLRRDSCTSGSLKVGQMLADEGAVIEAELSVRGWE
jgi:cytoskeletal protein CcmA (bactofilin family)